MEYDLLNNDSSFDLELIRTSQEAEEELRKQQEKECSSKNNPQKNSDTYDYLQNDSIDDFMKGIEMILKPFDAKTSTLHKSMPSNSTRTTKNKETYIKYNSNTDQKELAEDSSDSTDSYVE